LVGAAAEEVEAEAAVGQPDVAALGFDGVAERLGQAAADGDQARRRGDQAGQQRALTNGRPAVYCTDACRQRAYRIRKGLERALAPPGAAVGLPRSRLG
jgi:hypothetical protein